MNSFLLNKSAIHMDEQETLCLRISKLIKYTNMTTMEKLGQMIDD